MVLVPTREQASVYGHAIAPYLANDALLVFCDALALATGAFEPYGADVVIVKGERSGEGRANVRVAVRHDATGRAIERAIAHARAVFGAGALVGTTTMEAEVEAELCALESDAGGAAALLASTVSSAARARDSHAPEEAEVAFYSGLEEMLERRFDELRARVVRDRGSSTSVAAAPSASSRAPTTARRRSVA
jgi:ketol-acid reductoisomerase